MFDMPRWLTIAVSKSASNNFFWFLKNTGCAFFETSWVKWIECLKNRNRDQPQEPRDPTRLRYLEELDVPHSRCNTSIACRKAAATKWCKQRLAVSNLVCQS